MTHAWKLDDESDTTIADRIVAHINSHGECTAADLRAALPDCASSVTQSAHRAKEAGLITSPSRGVYAPLERPEPEPLPTQPVQVEYAQSDDLDVLGTLVLLAERGVLSQSEVEQAWFRWCTCAS